VTLILRPPGRGNWKPIVLSFAASKHSPLPLEVFAGQRVTISTHVFRVAKVLP
jgi:hypothetical protein